jgi:hypothetical protein
MVCPPDALILMRKVALHGAKHMGVVAHAIVASPEVEGLFLMKLPYAYSGNRDRSFWRS